MATALSERVSPPGRALPGRALPPRAPPGYLRAEQGLGRIDAAADIEAAASLLVGAIHGEVLPRLLFRPPGSAVTTPPDLAGRLAHTILLGIAPRPQLT